MYVANSLSLFLLFINVNRFVEGGILPGATYTGPSPFQIGDPDCVMQQMSQCQALADELGRTFRQVNAAWYGAFRGCYQHPVNKGSDAIEFHWTPGGSDIANGVTLPPEGTLDYNYARVYCGDTPPQIEKLTYSFPATTTDQTIHGFCVKGAAPNGVSIYSDTTLTYSYVPNYEEGATPLWSNSQQIGGGGFCEEGAFMRPSLFSNDSLGMNVSVEALSLSSDSPVTLCFFIEDGVDRNGGWENLEGFTFVSNYNNGLPEGAKIYCREMMRSDADLKVTMTLRL